MDYRIFHIVRQCVQCLLCKYKEDIQIQQLNYRANPHRLITLFNKLINAFIKAFGEKQFITELFWCISIWIGAINCKLLKKRT